MKKIITFLKKNWPVIVFLLIYLFIFRKIFFNGLIPFPGDLLTARYFPYNIGGWDGFNLWITYKEYILADVVRQIFPWRQLAMDIVASGSLPLWNIYSFAGNPLLANVQSAVFYPVNILFLFFAPKTAWIVYIMIQPILSATFMYLFIRNIKLSRIAALVAALIFTFTGYVMVWFEMGVIGHAALWLPLILWGINNYLEGNKRKYLAYSACGIAFSLFAGHTQTTTYVLLFSYAYLLFIGWGKVSKSSVFLGLVMLSLGVSLAAIQLLPTYELMTLSPRDALSSAKPFYQFIIPPSHIAMLFAPDYFGNPAVSNFWGKDYGEFMSYFGVVALLLGTIGFFNNFKQKLVKLCLFFIIIALLIAFVPFVAHLLFISNIPVLSTALPSRAIFLLGVCFSIASAFGVDTLLKNKQKKIFLPVILVLSIYCLLWAVTFLPQFDATKVSITQRNLILPTGIAFFVGIMLLFHKLSRRYFILWIIVFSCMAIEYSYFLNKYLPITPPQYMFPKQEFVTNLQKIAKYDRVFGYKASNTENNLNVEWRIQSVEGYDPLYIKRYSEFIHAIKTGRLEKNLPRTDAKLPESMPKQDSYAKQVALNLLGVKYVLDKDEGGSEKLDQNINEFPPSRYRIIYQHAKAKIYNNVQALPRAVIFYDYEVIEEDDRTLSRLFDKNFNYRQKIILSEKPRFAAKQLPITPAEITEYQANKVRIITNTKSDGMLFLSDNYYPGWQVSVDGKEAELLRADYTFRGVVVPSGKHTVEFVYRPVSLYLGAVISLLSIIALGIFIKKKH